MEACWISLLFIITKSTCLPRHMHLESSKRNYYIISFTSDNKKNLRSLSVDLGNPLFNVRFHW